MKKPSFPKSPLTAGLKTACSVLALATCLVAGGVQAADQGPRHHAQGQYDTVAAVYIVAEGDDLVAIGERFEVPVDALKAQNKLPSDEVKVGQKLVVAASAGSPTSAAGGKNPNVVFILADNVGYGDMGPYGGGELRGMPTPRVDQLAREGLRLTQYLVEASCTPSRAALMTGQYSIRNGLSLVALAGSPNTLPATAYTMGQLFKDSGYATAIFGKWHLGRDPQSLPGAHGFDEFYGIPPDTSWDVAADIPQIMQTHSAGNIPEKDLIERGAWIMQQKGNGELQRVKPFTLDVRAEIDNDLADRSIAFVKQQAAAGKPFFLYLPFSMGHGPNLPSKQFAGKSRIGQYGDKMMEGDYHVGQVMDALKELKIEDNTIFVFASDNGGTGQYF